MGFLADDRKEKVRTVGRPPDSHTEVEHHVVVESDDPRVLYDKVAELDHPEHYSIHGFDSTQLPKSEPGKHRRRKR